MRYRPVTIQLHVRCARISTGLPRQRGKFSTASAGFSVRRDAAVGETTSFASWLYDDELVESCRENGTFTPCSVFRMPSRIYPNAPHNVARHCATRRRETSLRRPYGRIKLRYHRTGRGGEGRGESWRSRSSRGQTRKDRENAPSYP